MIATKEKTLDKGSISSMGKTELQEMVIALKAKGHSIRKIGRDLDLSPTTVSNWVIELELEIARAKAIELEALYESALVAKEHRVLLLSDQLKAIREELSSRGLEEVPTKDLLKLQLEYLEALMGEVIEPIHLSDQDLEELEEL